MHSGELDEDPVHPHQAGALRLCVPTLTDRPTHRHPRGLSHPAPQGILIPSGQL